MSGKGVEDSPCDHRMLPGPPLGNHPMRWRPRFSPELGPLRQTYGDKRSDAPAKYDQALAALFYRSGWTQEELAQKEGKSRTWVVYRLTFGRFLKFVTTGDNFQIPPNLSERAFRNFWERTSGDERDRSREIARLMVARELEHRPVDKFFTAVDGDQIKGARSLSSADGGDLHESGALFLRRCGGELVDVDRRDGLAGIDALLRRVHAAISDCAF
jgi:hypothetical protein